MREIVPSLYHQVLVDLPVVSGDANAHLNEIFVILSRRFKKTDLPPKSLLLLLTSCKRAQYIWTYNPIWVNFFGYKLTQKITPPFSPLRLARWFHEDSKAPELQRVMLPGLGEGPVLSSNTLVNLVFSVTDAESLDFWYTNLNRLTSISSYPTGPQVKECKENIELLLSRGEAHEDIVSAVVCGKPNKVMAAVTAVTILEHCAVSSPKTLVDVAALLADFKCFLFFVGLIFKVEVAELKSKKWTISPASKFSSRAKSAIIRALGKMSWIQLFDAFKTPGLTKVIFKAIHITKYVQVKSAAQLEKEAAKAAGSPYTLLTVEEKAKVRLLAHLLREKRYPADAATFADWLVDVVAPLSELAKSRLFVVEEKWLSTEFDATLVGKKIAKPVLRIVSGELSRKGNSVSTWDHIFTEGLVTPAQILQNIRSLILHAYPADTAFAPILKAESNPQSRLPTTSLLKIDSFIAKNFSKSEIEKIRSKTGDDGIAKLDDCIFRDKAGTTHVVPKKRPVAARLSEESVGEYVAAVRKLLSSRMDEEGKVDGKGISVISLTPELVTNMVRSGLPPTIPKYSRVSMWRNESVCLERINPTVEVLSETGAATLSEAPASVCVGITWCEKPKDTACVDLDLSLMLCDSDWAFVDHCSFTNLTPDGCVHSGDLRSAPYPDGSREMVTVDLAKLRKRGISKVLVTVFSYSGQDMETLDDASIFVANPNHPGNGPGGLEMIAAARLTGAGKVNVAGYLDLEHPLRSMFVCMDQTLNIAKMSVTESKWLGQVAKGTKRVLTEAPNLRLFQLAAYYSALISDEVAVIHNSDDDLVVCQTFFNRTPGESNLDFYVRLQDAISKLNPTVSPEQGYDAVCENPVSLTFFGTEMDLWSEIAAKNGSIVGEDAMKLTVVNLAADSKDSTVKTIETPGTNGQVRVISGWDVSDLLK